MKKIILFVFTIISWNLDAFSQPTLQWVSKYYGETHADDNATKMVADASGNVYVTGTTRGLYWASKFCTVKYNTNGDTAWVRTYAGAASNWEAAATAIAIDASGNVYVTGYDMDSATNYNCCTIKYNAAGVQQWVATYNGPDSIADKALAITVDAAANIYITGYSKDTLKDWDFITVKYNSSGVQQWAQRYDGAGYRDRGNAITVDGSGNVFVTGDTWPGPSYADYCTIKYNSSGVQQWVMKYGLYNYDDGATAIALDASGNILVTGASNDSIPSQNHGYDYLTIKYNTSGVQQWVRRYNGLWNGRDVATAITVDGSGNAYITGVSWVSPNQRYLTIKYNSSGLQQWIAYYGIPTANNANDVAASIVLDGSNDIIVSGYVSTGSPGGDDRYATIKYNSAGSQLWAKEFDVPGNGYDDQGIGAAVDAAGNVYVSGSSKAAGNIDADYVTIKYDSSGTELWNKRLDLQPGGGGDFMAGMKVDAAGNVYVTGSSQNRNGNWDFSTIKYNSFGDTIWVRRYNGTANANDNAVALVVDGSGNVYVTGSTEDSTNNLHCCTIKYNSSGIQQWVATYSASAAFAIALDASGNIYVAGRKDSAASYDDMLVIKYNPAGVQQWAATFDGPGHWSDGAMAVTVDVSGDIIAAGYSTDTAGLVNFCTVKYNSSGAQQWAALRLLAGIDEEVNAIATDASGNIYLGGVTYDNPTDFDYCTIKYNAAGVEQWIRTYNGTWSGLDWLYGLAVSASGNVYVTGYCLDTITNENFCTIKYDPAGTQQWIRKFNIGDSYDEAYGIALDANENVYVTGGSDATQTGFGFYFVTTQYTSNGDSVWTVTYDEPEIDYSGGYYIFVDNAGYIYIAGYAVGHGTDADYCTMKYAPPVGIEEANVIRKEELFVFPNPATNQFTIYDLPFTISEIEIFNTFGEKVFSQQLKANSQKHLDVSFLAPGVYFVKAIGEKQERTGKFVKR